MSKALSRHREFLEKVDDKLSQTQKAAVIVKTARQNELTATSVWFSVSLA